MSLDLLVPVEEIAVAHTALISDLSLGKNIKIHTKQNGIPDLENVQIAILGVLEGRNAVDNLGTGKSFENIRKYLYQMFPGNWFSNIVDLGNIPKGETVEDTLVFRDDEIKEITDKHPITLVNSLNPYRIEGQKTGAFEICDCLSQSPDYPCN